MGIEQLHSPQPERGGDMSNAEMRMNAAIAAASKSCNVDADLLRERVNRTISHRAQFIKGPNDARNAVLNADFRGNLTDGQKKERNAYSRAIARVLEQLEPQEA